jgi:hypothetical protein
MRRLRQNRVLEDRGFVVKQKRFSIEQIMGILKQAELVAPALYRRLARTTDKRFDAHLERLQRFKTGK